MKKFGIMALVFLFAVAACSKQEEKTAKVEEKKEVSVQEGEVKLPEGHPPIGGSKEAVPGEKEGVEAKKQEMAMPAAQGHPTGSEVKREVRVPDEVKAKWKSVSLTLRDKDKKTEESLTVNIGKMTPVSGTKFAIRVDAFLPHYTMYDTYISSKSNDPVNPAALVELFEGDKSVAKGWVFSNFAVFNSFKHDKYEIQLPPVSLPQ